MSGISISPASVVPTFSLVNGPKEREVMKGNGRLKEVEKTVTRSQWLPLNTSITGVQSKEYGILVAEMVKKSAGDAGDMVQLGKNSGSRRSSGEGRMGTHPRACLRKFCGQKSWSAIVHGVERVSHD